MPVEITEATIRLVTRHVSRAECPWLDATVRKGTTVYLYEGQTFGVIGPDGVAVTKVPDELPFFELPRSALSQATGKNTPHEVR